MTDSERHAAFIAAVSRALVDPDTSAEELGRCVVVLERLVLVGAVDAGEAEALLDERIWGQPA